MRQTFQEYAAGATATVDLAYAEQAVVQFACDLVDAPPSATGGLTERAAEAILLAVESAREARPEVAEPTLVLTDTAHPAYLLASRLSGVTPVVVPADPSGGAPVGAMAEAMDDSTVLAVVSAPTYAHGVVDPVSWVSAAAAAKGVPLHVDAGADGWMLGYAERGGHPVPSWTFAVPGVRSITLGLPGPDLEAGATVLLFRDRRDRRNLLRRELVADKATTDPRPVWTHLSDLGHDGLVALAADVLDAAQRLHDGVEAVPGVGVLCRSETGVLAIRTDATLDAFTLADELALREWPVQPQPSRLHHPPTVRVEVVPGMGPLVEEFLHDLGAAVAAARQHGPLQLSASLAALVGGLTLAEVDEALVDRLLRLAGLTDLAGDLLPTARLAPLYAILDAAQPEVRDELTLWFSDRLAQRVRA